MPQMFLEIISLDQHVYEGEIASVTLPGLNGQLTILPNHLPLVTPLKPGEIIIRETDGNEKYLCVGNGFLAVAENVITILADSADLLDSLNEEKILEAKEKAEKILKEKKFADERSFTDASTDLQQSIAQLKIIKKRKKARR